MNFAKQWKMQAAHVFKSNIASLMSYWVLHKCIYFIIFIG